MGRPVEIPKAGKKETSEEGRQRQWAGCFQGRVADREL